MHTNCFVGHNPLQIFFNPKTSVFCPSITTILYFFFGGQFAPVNVGQFKSGNLPKNLRYKGVNVYGFSTLSWFAYKTGNANYFQKEKFLKDPKSMGKLEKYIGAGIIWISEFEQKEQSPLPSSWKGNGDNPVAFFIGNKIDSHKYYFATKGGQADHSHGNMDAGSFVFELDGIRWIMDPGSQDYYEVEKTGFDRWGMCQICDRWKLLTKNNFGHSTLTVNHEYFKVDGFAKLYNFEDAPQPSVSLNMTELYNGRLKNATRTFIKENDHALLIKDSFNLSDSVKTITSQLITTADVKITKKGVLLQKNGKQLKIKILSQPYPIISVVSLDPPPLKIDREIKGLKRIEFKYLSTFSKNNQGEIAIKLSDE